MVHAWLARYSAEVPAIRGRAFLADAEHGHDDRRACLSLCGCFRAGHQHLLSLSRAWNDHFHFHFESDYRRKRGFRSRRAGDRENEDSAKCLHLSDDLAEHHHFSAQHTDLYRDSFFRESKPWLEFPSFGFGVSPGDWRRRLGGAHFRSVVCEVS